VIYLSRSEGRVTTREFYQALLQIKPELQKLNHSVQRLQQWAFRDNGSKCADTRLKNIESALQKHRSNNQLLRIFVKLMFTLLGLLAGLSAGDIVALLG
jgi:hypothetical protein